MGIYIAVTSIIKILEFINLCNPMHLDEMRVHIVAQTAYRKFTCEEISIRIWINQPLPDTRRSGYDVCF